MIGNTGTAINNRVQKANKVYYQINQAVAGKKASSDNSKMGIYKIVYLRTLLSGSESWIMLTKHESRITGTVMRYVRKCVGKARRDRIRNNQIRGILHQEPVTEMVDRRELRGLGYLIGMGSNRKLRQVWERKVEGMQRRGRPRREWKGTCGS